MIVPNRDKLRHKGEQRRDAGMGLAAQARPDRVDTGKVAFLKALLRSPDSTATIDDATDNLAAEFRDGGKWRGTVTRSLAASRFIEAVGAVKSSRPSRHRGYVTVWRLVDRQRALAYLASLERSLDAQLATGAELAAGATKEPAPVAAGAGSASTSTSNQQSLAFMEDNHNGQAQ
jgi:hypothetical protein